MARAIVMVLVAVAPAAAQEAPAADLARHIDSLSAFDHPARMNAARLLRRVPASGVVPALVEAVRSHSDQFVRYRALVLLTAFNDPGVTALLRTLVTDRNDRVREVVYRWFERRPDPAMSASLLNALNTEHAEFVRPALIRAVAALPRDEWVQRALIAEAGRGADYFRSAVIEALGEHRAEYAVDTIASVAANEGPLQDDAVLALGRIGGTRAAAVLSSLTHPPLEAAPALQAAQCLLGDACPVRITWLTDTARSRTARPETVRAAVTALSAVAARGNAEATDALVALSSAPPGRLPDEAVLAFAAVALRQPGELMTWLARAPDGLRAPLIDLLRDGFESLEEDFAEEQFFAAARAAYWGAAEGSSTRTLTATLIDKLEF